MVKITITKISWEKNGSDVYLGPNQTYMESFFAKTDKS